MKKRIKILHVIGLLGYGGDTTNQEKIMNELLSKTDKYQIDFLTHDIGYDIDKVNEYEKNNHKVHILKGDVRKLGIFRYYFSIKKILKKEHYDIVQVHTGLQSGISLLAAKHAKVKKRICHAHVNSIQRKINPLFKIFFRPIFLALIKNNSTDRIAVSKESAKFLFPSCSYTIIPNCIDLKEYEKIDQRAIYKIKKQLHINSQTYVVGQIAGFFPMKNYKFTLEIARKLKNEHDIIFVLIGNGPLYETVKKKAIFENLNIKFVGKVDNVAPYIYLFNCMILPSLPGEGYANVLIEAQACNCPCLVSDYVPRAADLKIDLLEYYPINDANYWVKIIKNKKHTSYESDVGIKKIKKLKLNVDDVAVLWDQLYKK